MGSSKARSPQVRRLDGAFALTVVALAVLTAVSVFPEERLVISNGTLDVVLNTLTAIAAAAAAALAWARWRIEGDAAAIYESSAFLILATTRVVVVSIATFGPSDEAGLTMATAEQWPLYGWTVARAATAILLVVAAGARLRSARVVPIPPVVIQIAPAIAIVAAMPVLRALEPSLPVMLGREGFAALGGDVAARPGMEAFGVVLQAAIAAIYLVGAILYRRLYARGTGQLAGFLAVGLVVAAFSQIHWALLPGIYRPLVTADDFLRAAFSVILLVAIGAQSRVDVRALRVATARLEALRGLEADRADLQARSRVAREIHDGLAQDLWLVKLKVAQVSALDDLSIDGSRPVAELSSAVDRALAKARSIVGELRGSPLPRSLHEGVLQLAGDLQTTAGIEVDVRWDSAMPDVTGKVAEEALGIVGEALRNVDKHADAARIAIEASWNRGRVTIRIVDNGRGFDPTIPPDGFGQVGMRERAALIGGTVKIHSAPADGTTVTLAFDAPLADRDPRA